MAHPAPSAPPIEGMPQPQPPPPPGYQPPGFNQPQPPIQIQPVAIQVVRVGSKPTRMICPYCRADILTRVRQTAGIMTHVAALAICCVCGTCIPCCCCVPYCIDDCLNAEHACPNCDRHLGVYKPP